MLGADFPNPNDLTCTVKPYILRKSRNKLFLFSTAHGTAWHGTSGAQPQAKPKNRAVYPKEKCFMPTQKGNVQLVRFRHKGLRQLHEEGNAKGVASSMADKLRKLLFALETAETLEQLGRFPGWKLHPLCIH
jgi:hypothetical protein